MMANAAGPIFSLYALAIGLPKFEFVGTSAWFFFIMNLVKVPFSYGLGLIHGPTLRLNLVLLPPILLGIFIGRWLTQVVPAAPVRHPAARLRRHGRAAPRGGVLTAAGREDTGGMKGRGTRGAGILGSRLGFRRSPGENGGWANAHPPSCCTAACPLEREARGQLQVAAASARPSPRRSRRCAASAGSDRPSRPPGSGSCGASGRSGCCTAPAPDGR